jgi:hypothetical protein
LLYGCAAHMAPPSSHSAMLQMNTSASTTAQM